jgi:hypothetical protein
MPQRYPVGIQDFSEIRTGGYVYVDKTQFIDTLISQSKFYFLSRPRRFGKSLFVSTLDYLFKGRKELFEGLYIYDKWDWTQTSPIIKVLFSSIGHKEKGLYKAINDSLNETAKQYGISFEETTNSSKFKELIEKLSKKYGKVVVLIDEYDKPIIDYLGTNDAGMAKALENRDILKSFYSILKDADPYLKLVFITGVSKFSKVSIFSDLNNLNDLTLDANFGGICGITQSELDSCFAEELKIFDTVKIKKWYNGYNWKGPESVYNPFSLLNFFIKADFANYWFVSGTPTFLTNLSKHYQRYDFESVQITSSQLDAYDIERLQLIPLMFQTGYLTVKAYHAEDGVYTLGYPNEEVRRSYLDFLADAYTQNPVDSVAILATEMRNALKVCNLTKVESIFNTVFKSIPYEIWQKENEHYYHAIIHLTFRLLGIYVESEVQSSDGRLDALVRLENYVYAFEFKLGGSAAKALQQIKDRGYLMPYQNQGKTCIGIGLNFSKKLKKVQQLLWEELK